MKLNIQKTKVMASGLITLWQIDGETVEAVKTLASWKESFYKLDSKLKSRDITLLTKFCVVKAMVFQ